MKRCVVCIGSNHNREENLALARRELIKVFPNVRFSSEQKTLPLDMKSQALFSNQIATFFSDLEEEQIKAELKKIESAAGRCQKNKEKEIIALDMDLLLFHNRVLKPEDMKREYVVKGIEEILKIETEKIL